MRQYMYMYIHCFSYHLHVHAQLLIQLVISLCNQYTVRVHTHPIYKVPTWVDWGEMVFISNCLQISPTVNTDLSSEGLIAVSWEFRGF